MSEQSADLKPRARAFLKLCKTLSEADVVVQVDRVEIVNDLDVTNVTIIGTKETGMIFFRENDTDTTTAVFAGDIRIMDYDTKVNAEDDDEDKSDN